MEGEGGSAAFLAAGHDGGVEAFAKTGGKVVNLVRTIDFNGFTGGVEDNFAVLALMQVLLQLSTCLSSDRVVDQIVEKLEKFGAGHFSTPVFGTEAGPFFLRK